MSFHLIDMDHWPRKEFYLHYMNEVVQEVSEDEIFDFVGVEVFDNFGLCSTIHEKSEPEAGRQGVRISCI